LSLVFLVNQSINHQSINQYINVRQKVDRELTNLVCHMRGINKTERDKTKA